MKEKMISLMVIFIFSLSKCSGQNNMITKQYPNNITTEMEVANYIYKNFNSLDFDDNREELILWDLKHDTINMYLREKYKNEKDIDFKLNKLERLRILFYRYAIQNVNSDYEKYYFSDGPFFNYLLKKDDKNVKMIILKILKNYNNLTIDQQKEINNILPTLILYIQDPDGFTNLRKEKDRNSKILQQIKSGEKVEVLNTEGNWWLIKTQEGKEGYVYYDRIKIK